MRNIEAIGGWRRVVLAAIVGGTSALVPILAKVNSISAEVLPQQPVVQPTPTTAWDAESKITMCCGRTDSSSDCGNPVQVVIDYPPGKQSTVWTCPSTNSPSPSAGGSGSPRRSRQSPPRQRGR